MKEEEELGRKRNNLYIYALFWQLYIKRAHEEK
jgi:hypothetical protein